MPTERLGYTLYIKDEASGKLSKLANVADSAGKRMDKGFRASEKSASQLERTLGRLQRTIVAFAGVYVFRELTRGLTNLIRVGFEYNKVLETSKIGIAAVIASQAKMIPTIDETASATDRLIAAHKLSTAVIEDLRAANLKTAATFPQLITMFQQALPHALAVGFNIKQVEEFVTAMSQAATSMGIPLNMMSEEMRSMLKGTITAKNTLIAVALGLDNATIKAHKTTGDLFNFLMQKLSTFKASGTEIQNTFTGIFTNMMQSLQETVGPGFEGLFEDIKDSMRELSNIFASEKFKSDISEINANLRVTLSLIKSLVGVYYSLPDDVVKAGGVGLLGKIMFGSWTIGKFALGLTLINDLFKELNKSLPKIVQLPSFKKMYKDAEDAVKAIENIINRLEGKLNEVGGQVVRKKVTFETHYPIEKPPVFVDIKKFYDVFYTETNRALERSQNASYASMRSFLDKDEELAERYQKRAIASLTKKTSLEEALEKDKYAMFDKMRKDHLTNIMKDLQAETDVALKAAQDQVAVNVFEMEEKDKKLKSKAKKLSDDLISMSQRTADAMEQNFSDFFFDALTGQFKSLGDYVRGVLRSIQRAFADYLGQEARQLLFGGGSTKAGVTGGLLGGLGSALSDYASLWTGPSDIFHQGGIVGETPVPTRSVPTSLFSNAPRFHDGLYPGEFPAILQKGEIVLPKNAQVASTASTYNITINAVDAKSFNDLVERNPQAITAVVSKTLQDGGLRNEIREATT